MAIVYGILSITVIDDNGARAATSIPVSMNDASTLANIKTDGLNLVANIAACLGGIVEKWNIRVTGDQTGLGTDITAGQDITQTGTFDFQQSGSVTDLQELVLPGLGDHVVLGGAIDLTAAEIIALVTSVTTPATHLNPVSRAHNSLTGLDSALFSFRKRRPAIARRSKP